MIINNTGFSNWDRLSYKYKGAMRMISSYIKCVNRTIKTTIVEL